MDLSAIHHNKVHILVNGLLFQAIWFALIFQLVIVSAGLFIIYVFHFHFTSSAIRSDWFKVIAVSFAGIFIDCLLTAVGVLVYQDAFFIGQIPILPWWHIGLWIGFAMCAFRALTWMTSNLLLTIIGFSLGGPASYYAAVEFGALEIMTHSVEMIALAWIVIGLLAYSLQSPRTLESAGEE